MACAEHRARFADVWSALDETVEGGRVGAFRGAVESNAVGWYAAMQFHMIWSKRIIWVCWATGGRKHRENSEKGRAGESIRRTVRKDVRCMFVKPECQRGMNELKLWLQVYLHANK